MKLKTNSVCHFLAVSLPLLTLAPATLALGQTSTPAASAAPASSVAKSQSERANPKAALGAIEPKDAKVTAALDPHNLAGAKALVGKSASICGTIAGIYAPKGNKLVILNFDHDFRTAVSAIIESEDFAKFPDVKSLVGKKVLVTGKFIAYRETTEVKVSEPTAIKIVK